MTKYQQTFVAAIVFAVFLGCVVDAQNTASAVQAARTLAAQSARVPDPELTPLKLQVVIARYQGETKISSLPYTLSVNANGGRSSLRMGGQVPVVSATIAPNDGKALAPPGPLASISYKSIGTNIDCDAAPLDGGRFKVHVVISDDSVYSEEQPRSPGLAKGSPSFRSFSSDQTLILKDGQSTQFTTATDKVSGEVTKVDVTLTVMK